MTIGQFLNSATNRLQQAGVASARLDCLVLLEDAIGSERAWILAHPEAKIPPATEVELNTKITQRAQHTPLAYIRGKVEFYGREFVVNKHVLVPRPETEAIIDLLKELNPPLSNTRTRKGQTLAHAAIVDVGTGSGAIAITAKLEFPKAHVVAIDIDPDTLAVTHQNAKRLNANIALLQGDLLTPLTSNIQHPASILANLPYVPDSHPINEAAKHEPKLALFAGDDGLDLYRRFWEQITALKSKPQYILTESLQEQHKRMTDMAKHANYRLAATKGLVQQFEPGPSSER